MITRRRAALVRFRLLPWWGKVTLIYVAARIFTTILLLILASVQGANPWTGAQPDYFSFASIWDGRWYQIVAATGYPTTLPITDTGHIGENAWAFMPVYPYLVRGLMTITQLPWTVVSVAVSVLAGWGAALVFYRLMRRTLGENGAALFAVVLFCIAPLSPMFQVAYAESLYLLLLNVALYLVVVRNYWLAIPVVAVMAFTRPSGLAFALFLAAHLVHRWWVRRTEPFPLREGVAVVALTGVSGFAGLAWPVIAGIATGVPNAYTETELAWRSAYIGYQELVPFAAWFQGGNWWLGFPAGTIVVLCLVIAMTLAMFTAPVKRIGVDLRLWVASYLIYLLAVFFPQSSTFRLLMPAFPLLGALAVPRSRLFRWSIVIVFLIGQWLWLLMGWGVDGADWTPP